MHTTTCWFAPKAQTNSKGISITIIHESPEFSFKLEPLFWCLYQSQSKHYITITLTICKFTGVLINILTPVWWQLSFAALHPFLDTCFILVKREVIVRRYNAAIYHACIVMATIIANHGQSCMANHGSKFWCEKLWKVKYFVENEQSM